MTNVAIPKLQQMLDEMGTALADEIKAQSSRKSSDRIAINGKLLAEESGHYIYTFSLKDPWEPEDDTPIRIKVSDAPTVKGTVVTSTGTTVTITTEEALQPRALRQVEIISDSTQLLERLRDALKNNDEGASSLGSKSFGLLPSNYGRRVSQIAFGKFNPDYSQNQAIQMALGSQITYIVGPPGTGKSSTLAAIAFAHLYQGHTVLIAAHTNIAVDNAIMKLADICHESTGLDELRRGHIVRFGTPQHRSLIEDSKYEDIYLPKVIKRRGSDLHQQRDILKVSLGQILSNLDTIVQAKVEGNERWQTERLSLRTQCDKYQTELTLLKDREKQRLANINAHLQNITNLYQQAQQYANIIYQELAKMVALETQYSAVKAEYLRQINELGSKLAEAQRMSSIKLFIKRIDPERLTHQLADAKQQVWNAEQALTDVYRQMNVAHSSYTVAMKRVEQLTASYQETLIQRNAPSPDLDRMETLRTAIIQLEELIKQGDISLQREREETQQKSNMMQGDVDRIKEQMAAIDKQIMDLEMSIVAEARIIATTLSKIYMNKNLRERRFDVVILDEVSMAPLPAVYIATSHADDSVVAIGDPHQLAPIVTAVTHNAQKWLGTDLFALNGVTLERAIEGLGNSTLLKQQSRMHPDISVISRKHVYRGQITDRRGDDLGAYAKVTPLPGKPLLLCDTSDVNPIATQLDHGRINVYHALCTIAIARQALASLPKADAQGGATPRIGLVTPYRKQAELLQYLIQDAGLKDLVRAGTVHRFQGLEFEVVIFDTVESRPCSPIEYTNGVWGSKAMRLVNVAVTRPKHKLIIVANADYIQKRFARDSTLSLALREAKGADSIQSHEVIGITLPPLSETLRYLLQDHDYEMLHRETLSSTSQYELKLLNENSFYSLFQTDVSTARKQIIIFSPFLTPRRTAKILPLLSERLQAGVKVIVITKPVDESNTTAEEAEPLLKDTRIELRNLSGMHEKLVLIDEEIVYIGSLNVLSHANSTEIMLRVKSPGFVKEVWSITNRNGVKKDTRDAFAPNSIVPGPDIVLSRSELPKSVCEKCGNTMIVKIGVNGAFYGCTDFPACRQSEDISEKQLSGLKQLINVHCDNCGGSTPMRIKTYRKDAWLECSAITPCGFQRHIKII